MWILHFVLLLLPLSALCLLSCRLTPALVGWIEKAVWCVQTCSARMWSFVAVACRYIRVLLVATCVGLTWVDLPEGRP